MSTEQYGQLAHLARRAGFGATRAELEEYASKGYEAVVEELLNPGDPQVIPDDILRRRQPEIHEQRSGPPALWVYRMIGTRCPLEEKLALFWHSVFATGNGKNNNLMSSMNQLEMFRRYGLGRFDELLVQLSRDPAMIVWLDNQTNHNGAINENYGREILELFSMGVGSYTEDDIKECSRAFTGWTLGNAEYLALRTANNSVWPYSRIAWHFDYQPEDHDDGEKTFLGESGRFNGEDVVEIICRQPATARFIARHLYSFFVADEVPVPQWSYTPARDPDAIEELSVAYMSSGHDIRSMLRVLFNSGFFKSARYSRVKSPAELVIGTLRMTGEFREGPDPAIYSVPGEAGVMGQTLLNPPSVEGWHTGVEWINSGALVDRVNFAADHLGDVDNPGVRAIIDRLADMDGGTLSPDELVDGCLDLVGPLAVSDETREELLTAASRGGDVALRDREPGDESEQRVGEVLKLIASSREYQLA